MKNIYYTPVILILSAINDINTLLYETEDFPLNENIEIFNAYFSIPKSAAYLHATFINLSNVQ